MKKIQILGSGCAKCNKLYDAVNATAQELGIEYEIEKVEKIEEFIKLGVMMTPALVVDGVVKIAGNIPKQEDIKEMLT